MHNYNEFSFNKYRNDFKPKPCMLMTISSPSVWKYVPGDLENEFKTDVNVDDKIIVSY